VNTTNSRNLLLKPISTNSTQYFGSHYIHLPVDLSILNFPKAYIVKFEQDEYNVSGIGNASEPNVSNTITNSCPAIPPGTNSIYIASGFINIPPPVFALSVSPNNLEQTK
jgi:hypothetical protein